MAELRSICCLYNIYYTVYLIYTVVSCDLSTGCFIGCQITSISLAFKSCTSFQSFSAMRRTCSFKVTTFHLDCSFGNVCSAVSALKCFVNNYLTHFRLTCPSSIFFLGTFSWIKQVRGRIVCSFYCCIPAVYKVVLRDEQVCFLPKRGQELG